MPSSGGWYLAGPLIAFALIGILAGVLRWGIDRDGAVDEWDGDGWDGLDVFAASPRDDDYGLLSPAALADDIDVADEVRRLLSAAGIRSTQAVRYDGRIIVLVFADQVDEARRLAAGGSPEGHPA
jgi:hypothetical protein